MTCLEMCVLQSERKKCFEYLCQGRGGQFETACEIFEIQLEEHDLFPFTDNFPPKNILFFEIPL